MFDHDKALYKSTFTFTFTGVDVRPSVSWSRDEPMTKDQQGLSRRLLWGNSLPLKITNSHLRKSGVAKIQKPLGLLRTY